MGHIAKMVQQAKLPMGPLGKKLFGGGGSPGGAARGGFQGLGGQTRAPLASPLWMARQDQLRSQFTGPRTSFRPIFGATYRQGAGTWLDAIQNRRSMKTNKGPAGPRLPYGQ